MRSVMKHQFSQVPRADIPRSSFDRSHGLKTTFNAGILVPIFIDEALPGDTFNCHLNVFARLATPLHPFMDNMFLDTFFFAVPLRLVWDNFQRFMGEQDDPGDSTDFLIPQIVSPVGGYAELSLYDYFGLPTKRAGISHSALPLRAYNLIYNQWFRDQNLQNSKVVDKDDGPDNYADYALVRRGKRHDYFTSALPWPQKGPAVELPLGSQAPVMGLGTAATDDYSQTGGTVIRQGDGVSTWTTGAASGSRASTTVYMRDAVGGSGGNRWPAIYADLSAATAATINQLRQAFQIQKIYERDARGGSRYTEIIQAHFGVTSPDARLQRAEYLGGGSVPLNVNPIAQTSSVTGAPTPLGNLSAMGTAHMRNVGFTKSFTEHSIVIGLVCARADLNYQQGLNRMWTRQTRFDFYWPALSHIGEQAVYNEEIYAVGSAVPGQDKAVFGYQERWAEYRYKPSQITGQFRSNATTPLDTWHLAQNFASLPVLNASFIEENPPVSRVIAVTSEPQFLYDSYISYRCARPMPVYSVPGLIDHF